MVKQKLNWNYYKMSREEQKNYSDYQMYRASKAPKYSKVEPRMLITLVIALFMPVIWSIFQSYAGLYGVWMSELPEFTLQIIMGAMVGFVLLDITITNAIKEDFRTGKKIVGENFMKIHKQNCRWISIVGFLSIIFMAFVITSISNKSSYYGQGLEVALFTGGLLLCMSIFLYHSMAYSQIIKYEIEHKRK